MWYCLSDNKEYGPFSTQEAMRFISGHPDCFVWQEGMPEWIPAFRFEMLAGRAHADMPARKQAMHSGLDFKIFGDDMQYVEVSLRPEEAIIAEPGAMICKEGGVQLEAMLGTGRKQGLFSKMFGAGKRVLTGESAFLSAFINMDRYPQKVSFSAPYPGKIIPVSLEGIGGEIICQKESFLCSEAGIDIGVFFQKRIFTAMFGGGGFIMQRLNGSGVVFIHAGGMICEYDLKEGETLQVDAGCLVAFQPSVDFSLKEAGNLKSQIFGGSGLFFANMIGPGKVWVQSLPFSRLAQRFASVIQPRRK